MKRKLLFLGMAALMGAFMLSVSSCGKDYKKEIDDLTRRMDELERSIGKVANGATVSADGKTLTVSFNDDTSVTFTPPGAPVKYPIVVEETDGYVTIKFWDGEKEREYKFKLAKEVDGILDFELMGVVGVDYSNGGRIPYDPTQSISMYGYASGSNWMEGVDQTYGPAEVDFEYAHILGISNKWQMGNTNARTWTAGGTGGRYTVLKNQVLTDIQGAALVVRVSPADVDASAIEFALQNSALGVTSFDLKAAQKVTKAMTRATAGASAVWTIPLVDNGEATFDKLEKFDALYMDSNGDDYIFTVNADKAVSNYGLVFDYDNIGSPDQSYVVEVGGNGPVPPGAAVGANITPDFDIIVGEDYDLSFFSDYPVFDYYVEAADAVAAGYAQFKADKLTGTFRVDTDPDQLTSAYLTLNVYAIQLDGGTDAAYVGKTTIRVRILPKPLATTEYDLGNIVIEDSIGIATPVNYWPANITGRMPVQKIDLAKMFTELGTASANKWKSTTLGADLTVINPTMKRGTTDVTADFFGVATPSLVSFTRSNGTTATTSQTDAANMMLTLNYADNKIGISSVPATATPTFEVGEQYTMTLNFYHTESGLQTLMNTVVVKFTPVLPDINSFLKKDLPFWNTDATILHGYFKESLTVLANQPSLPPLYDIVADGGVTSAGSSLTKNWLALTLAVAPQQPISGSQANTLLLSNGTAAADPNDATTVEWGMSTNDNGGGGIAGNGGGRVTNRGYNQPVRINVTAGDYLNLYTYDADDVQAALGFQLQLASAVEQGTIDPAGNAAAISVPFTSADTHYLYASDFLAKNYNQVVYNVFKEWITPATGPALAAYRYTYIQDVAVSVPTEFTTYYEIVSGVNPVDPIAPAVAPAPERDGGNAAYVGIKMRNLQQTAPAAIRLTITDVFGYVKTVDVPLELKRMF